MALFSRVLLIGVILQVFYTATSTATPLVHQWSQSFGNTMIDRSTCIAVDMMGNVVIAGQFSGSVDFGGGDVTSVGVSDMFLVKYDASGTHLWTRQFGDEQSSPLPASVVVDASGHVVVTGSFILTANFGGSDYSTPDMYSDVFLAKYDADGNHTWSQQLGGPDVDFPNSLAVDGAGNLVITGFFLSTADFGGDILTALSLGDIFVARYDANGVHQWSRRFGDMDGDIFTTSAGTAVVVDASGSVLLSGGFSSTVNFGGGDLTSTGSGDIFLARYNADGLHQWSQRFGGTGSDRSEAVVIDPSGNVLLTGSFRETANFGGGDLTSAGDTDIFVAKYDASGAHLWSQRFGSSQFTGGSERESGTSIGVDATGNISVIGDFWGTLDFGGGSLTSAGVSDVFLARFDADGVHQWSQRFGDTFRDEGTGVAVDGSGNVVVTGWFFGGPVNFGGSDLTSAGFQDVFLAKFANEGTTPVLFSAFAAVAAGGTIELSWELWSDESLDGFTLYRWQGATVPVAIASGEARSTRSYSDASVGAGETYTYQLAIRTTRGVIFRSPPASATVLPLATLLEQNFPNPFNPRTTIEYTVNVATTVAIDIFDATGALVRRLEEGERVAGTYTADWDGRDNHGRAVASGTYFYRLSGIRYAPSRKMILLK